MAVEHRQTEPTENPDRARADLQQRTALARQQLKAGPSLRSSEGDSVVLLDGGAEAFPRMLAAIESARKRVHLEVYAFHRRGVGAHFMKALVTAAQRGVRVRLVIDGWGTLLDGRRIAAELRPQGVEVIIYNPFRNFFVGRFWRNHRKILLVDEDVSFVGGINIGDSYADEGKRLGWADLAVEIHGPACAQAARRVWREHRHAPRTSVQILTPRLGAGKRLQKRYLQAIGRAHHRIHLAHAYFLPGPRLVRALRIAARRGVDVVLLLAGRSDVPFARPAWLRLYRKFLEAGVRIYELERTPLHAKAAVVDASRMLIGSFNLDPLSLVNLEVLVDVDDEKLAAAGEQWFSQHLLLSKEIRAEDVAGSFVGRLFLDGAGTLIARMAQLVARFIAPRRGRELR